MLPGDIVFPSFEAPNDYEIILCLSLGGNFSLQENLAAASQLSQADEQQLRYCDKHFGDQWLHDWNATAEAACHSVSDNGASSLTCRYFISQDYLRSV